MTGEVELTPVPNTNPATSLSNGVYVLDFGSDRATKDWQSKVTTVTVNGKEYTKCRTYSDLTSNGYKLGDVTGYSKVELWIEGSEFADVNQLVIQADGYETLTLKLNKNGSLVTGSEVTPPATIAVPTEAPTITNEKSSSGNSYYVLTFGSDYTEWASRITGITLGTTSYTSVESVDNIGYDSKYCVDQENANIAFYISSFTNYPCEMVISADGVESLTLVLNRDGYSAPITVSIKQAAQPENPGSGDADGEEAVKPVDYSASFLGNTLYFDRTGSNEVAAKKYMAAITDVIIGTTELSESDLYYVTSGEFYRSYNGTEKYLSFSSSDFSKIGNTVITIKATGYKNQTVTINAQGNLVTE